MIGTVNLAILTLGGSVSFGYRPASHATNLAHPLGAHSGTATGQSRLMLRQDAPLLFAHHAVSVGVVHMLISRVSAQDCLAHPPRHG